MAALITTTQKAIQHGHLTTSAPLHLGIYLCKCDDDDDDVDLISLVAGQI